MNKFRDEIVKLLKKELKLKEPELTMPPDPKLGDFAFPCFVLSKKLKKNPVEIAKQLAEKIKPKGIIKEIKSAGPYLNFYLDKAKIAEGILKEINKQKDKFGIMPKTKKIVLVESPAPNTNKPLHLGHIRNMVLGTALLKLLEAAGHTAYLVNVNNDRGVHICKSMLAYEKWGKGDSPQKSKLKPDHFVGKYYVMFAQKAKENPELEKQALEMLKKWESGDKETVALWKKMNQWALDGFKETYKKFSIKFKKEYYESETYKKGKEIILKGLDKGIFEKDENNAVIADLSKKNYGKKVLLRPDGTSVYITQDIYLAKKRYDDFKFDKMFYVVATEQNYHFNVLFEVLKMLKFPFADKVYHFAYGMVHLPSGRMKSREGTVVDADDLVKELEMLASQETKKRHSKINVLELKKRAETLGMGAIRFYMLKYDAVKDMLFDPEVSISFEGETGPYIQYAYARICSIFRKHNGKLPAKVDFSALNSAQEKKLITLLSQYPETVSDAAENCRPHTLCRYLLDLAQAFNEFYHAERVLQAAPSIRDARLYLITSIKQVLENGLAILEINAPEKM